MIDKCPGRSFRDIQAESFNCPRCGYDIEIFSDEARAICPACRAPVARARKLSCSDWCKSAEECLGR